MTRSFLLAGMISMLATGAGAVGPTYHAPVEAPVVLAAPQLPALTRETPQGRWWSAFQDPELDALIGRALAANLDVRQAVARVDQARALFKDSQLDQFPRITSHASYSRSDEQVPGFGAGRVQIEQADLGFDAAWEIDLFGRVRHQVEAARAEADAARADLEDVRVSIAAEVARNYLELRGANARRVVAEENAAAARETLRLTRLRLDVGYGDPVDVQSAQASLKATEALIPPLVAQQMQAGYRLAVLLGQRPGALDQELAALAPQPLRATAIPVGDVSGFLRRRPDVRVAERRLAAETARTGVATADLFPRVRVTGFIGLLSGNVSDLFRKDSQAWAVSPTVSWPAFDLGGARARLRAQRAKGEESLAAYQQTALRAIEDLNDSVAAYGQRQAQTARLAEQADAARKAADLARIRYREGGIDFLRVLDADRSRLQAEDALTQAQTASNTDVVAIYKALGGGWG